MFGGFSSTEEEEADEWGGGDLIIYLSPIYEQKRGCKFVDDGDNRIFDNNSLCNTSNTFHIRYLNFNHFNDKFSFLSNNYQAIFLQYFTKIK